MARRISVELLGNSASLERAFSRSAHSAKTFDRDIGRAGRGVAAATIGFRGLGRSVAFASSAFIGAAGIALGVKEAISGAESLRKAQDSVRTVLERTGQAVGKLTPQYLATAKAAARLGVDQATALGGLATATTLTGNAGAAMRAYVEALNISKVTHKSFASVLTATAKGQEGITTSLQRYGIEIKKGTSGQAQFVTVMKRFGGQAEANTSNLDRLKASASNLAAQIGGPLLGVLDRVAGKLTSVAADISGFFSRIGQAHTFQAKVDVVVSGLENVARGLTASIGAAVSGIDWNAVWSNARGVADGLQRRLDQINWGGVGSAIGKGIAKGVAGASAAFKALATRVEKAFNSIDFVALGVKLGPALAGAVVSAFVTLTDPSFWLHHWQLALSVGLVAFGDGVGRLAGKFAAPLVRVFGDLGAKAALVLASGFERLSGKLGSAVLAGLLRLPGLVAHALSPLTNVVERVFNRLGSVAQFVVKVLGVDAAINIVTRAVSQLAHLIGHGLDSAWDAMKRAALKTALAIVEPFSHLPGFLGGGPFQQMKASLQNQLSQMNRSAANSANSIERGFARMSRRVAGDFRGMASSLIGSIGAAVQAVGASLGKLKLADVKKAVAQADAAVPGQLSTKGGSKGAAAASTTPTGFTLPFRLQLAQAKASATATIKDDLQVARDIRAFILKAIPRLHGQKLIDAYNQLGQINQTIASDVQQATKKAKQAVTSFTLPPKLTLALARDAALGLDPTKDLLKAKNAILKFIRTHKKNIAALTDAYNQLASLNQQIGDSVKSALGGFKQINTRKITAGLGLTAAQRAELRARLSQVGPGGTVPGQGVGAFGFIINPKTNQPIILTMDGKKVGEGVRPHEQKARRRNSTQVRGPHAGVAFGF